MHRPRDEKIFSKKQKLVGVITGDRITIALDDQQTFLTDGLYSFGLKNMESVNYLMAILNSKLFVFLYRLLASEKGRALAQVKPTIIAKMPVRTINLSDKNEKQKYSDLIRLADRIQSLFKNLSVANTPHDKESLQRQIDVTDKQIDQLVYKLYGLTEEEVGVVEGKK